MKRLLILALLGLALTGCGQAETFETMTDVYEEIAARPQFLQVVLPEEAAVPTLEQGDGSLYLCDGYTLSLQTFANTSLEEAFLQTTGFSRDRLTVLHRQQPACDRYDCAWTASGETGESVCRAVILDDGHYRYAVTVMAPAETAGELNGTWQKLLGTVGLSTD